MLETRPELFPELYDPEGLRRRAPRRELRQSFSKIMAEHWRVMDLESRRAGTPKADGEVFGISEKVLAVRTKLGDPRVETKGVGPSGKHWKNWRGRRRIQDRLRRLRDAAFLEGHKAEQERGGAPTEPAKIMRRRPSNRRHLVEKGPRAGTWRYYPAVRRIALKFMARIKLDRTWAAEKDDLLQRRARGEVDPIVDVQRRRARDREIKFRQRERKRELRLLELESERTGAPKQTIVRRAQL